MIKRSPMSLLMRLLLPLSLVVLVAGSVRTVQLWREEVQRTQDSTQQFVTGFFHLYGKRVAELASQGQLTEVQALLNREVHEYALLAAIRWDGAAGQVVQVTVPSVTLQMPDWAQRLQRLGPLATTLPATQQSAPLTHQNQSAGVLTLTLTYTSELNRIWRAVRLQLWGTLVMLLAMLGLIALVLRSSLRGLTSLSKAARLLPEQPDLRIRPRGAREVQQLASAFNVMATALNRAHGTAKSQLEKTTWLANHDALTNLPNRNLLADRLRQALHRCERHHEMLGLCFIDLDNFKPVNDQYGHTVGDEVLMTAARRMHAELRDTDTLARVGGDEFVLLLSSLQQRSEALAVVERVLCSLRQPIEVEGVVVHISGSAGLTTQAPVVATDGTSLLEIDQLLRQADQAMYQAKQAGRDQLCVWDQGQVATAAQVPLPEELRLIQAIENGELRLHFQPKVHIRNGKLVGLEALVRWQHPTDGILLPGDFLPQIENTQTIVLLGQWALTQALEQLQRWQQLGVGWPVSVNVSARQFVRPEFMGELAQALEQHPTIPPKWLTLEILETSSLEDLREVRGTIEAAQALGVSCSLDDFGTGYSSLSYLKQLPVQEVKIDQSFVRGMLDDNGDLALVEGIITLAKVFSRHLVAEGVESPEHGVMLQRMGCNVAQGWAIAKAMPADAVAGWEQQYKPHPMWSLWSKTRWDLSNFPLMTAMRDHQIWLAQLESALSGQISKLRTDADQSYLASRLGGWYRRLGELHYGQITGFKEISQLHYKMHQQAAELSQLCQTGDFEPARRIHDELRRLSPRLLRGIEMLQHAVLSNPATVDTNF